MYNENRFEWLFLIKFFPYRMKIFLKQIAAVPIFPSDLRDQLKIYK